MAVIHSVSSKMTLVCNPSASLRCGVPNSDGLAHCYICHVTQLDTSNFSHIRIHTQIKGHHRNSVHSFFSDKHGRNFVKMLFTYTFMLADQVTLTAIGVNNSCEKALNSNAGLAV